MKKETVQAMCYEMIEELQDCINAINDYPAEHQDIKDEWKEKVRKAYEVLCC